jgi:hypothetical protein
VRVACRLSVCVAQRQRRGIGVRACVGRRRRLTKWAHATIRHRYVLLSARMSSGVTSRKNV